MLHGREHKYMVDKPNQAMENTKWKSLCAATRQIQISWHIHFRPCFRLHTIRVASFILDFLHLLLLRLCLLLFARFSFELSKNCCFFFFGAWMLCCFFVPFYLYSFSICVLLLFKITRKKNIFSLSRTENVFLSLCLANKSKIFHICEHCVLCGGT